MNILILSVGTRNKIVQYFKKEFKNIGKIVATDCSQLAPALYEADNYYITPTIDKNNYIQTILQICKKDNIKGLLSLIDPELSLLAKHEAKFLQLGIVPMVSSYNVTELCLDKYNMYNLLINNGFNCAKSYINITDFKKDLYNHNISFPVFIKPIKGSASININKVFDLEELEILWAKHQGLMIQEFLDGQEYGADCYIDMISGKMISIFLKQKIKMRAGETDKAVSIKNEQVFSLLLKLNEVIKFKGVIDVDLFEVNGKIYISEINPRFGGGYPHAYECGVNFPKMILNNLEKKINNPQIGDYDESIYMMKYNEIKLFKDKKE